MSIAEDGLESIVLPLPPEYWDYTYVPRGPILYSAEDGIQVLIHGRQEPYWAASLV